MRDEREYSFTLILLVFSCLAKLCMAQQRFSIQPSYTEVNPGEKARLECRIENKSRVSECIWQKDGKPVRVQRGKYELLFNRDFVIGNNKNQDDCSLIVHDANIKYDDGYWQCQVTASSLDTDDALSSKPTKLVVRVPPAEPKLFFDDGRLVNRKENVTVRDEEVSRVRCESRGGNPAAILRWFLDNDIIDEAAVTQRNESAKDSNTFNAVATIDTVFHKKDNGKRLRCAAFHPAFASGARSTSALLDVQFAPVVSLEHQGDGGQLRPEADVDHVKVRCRVKANPEADVIWRKDGGQAIFSVGESLSFEPVRLGDGGTYLCQASNVIGRSAQLSFSFTVQYGPRDVLLVPDQPRLDLEVDQRARLLCDAKAQPQPQFQWQLRARDKDKETDFVTKFETKVANLVNVSYGHEGQWRCVVTNTIKGERRRVVSEVIDVEVRGRPRASNLREERRQSFQRNQQALIQVNFCSDPIPQRLTWTWSKGQTSLSQGESAGKFAAGAITRVSNESDCYRARLKIASIHGDDADVYLLRVSNARGSLEVGISVEVVDPVSMGLIVSGVLVLLAIVTLVAVLFVVFYRRQHDTHHSSSSALSTWRAGRARTPRKASSSSIKSRGVNKSVSISRPISSSNLTTLKGHRGVDVGVEQDVKLVNPPDLGVPVVPRRGSSSQSLSLDSSQVSEVHDDGESRKVSSPLFNSMMTSNTLGRKTPQNTDAVEMRGPDAVGALSGGVKVLPVTSAIVTSYYTGQPRRSVIRRQ